MNTNDHISQRRQYVYDEIMSLINMNDSKKGLYELCIIVTLGALIIYKILK